MSSDPSPPQRHALGVDFGTSNTVAVARWPDGRARPILIDGSPLLPSAVYAEPAGQLIAGRDAVHSARLDPARFEPNPKRRIDDGTVLLGAREIPVGDLFAAVLARVAEEWHRAVGPVRPTVTLTCPATWGATRRTMLAEAAASAGLEGARLVAEPVAAATYFAEVLGREVPIGSVVVVHDFGAGTFDASVVARTADGFEVLAVDGRDDIGGLDVDAAIVEHLGRTCGERDPATWQRLVSPDTVEERRAQRQLWDDVRVAKERLSRTQSADLVIPLLDLEVHLTRQELEELAEPVIAQTVEVTRAVMRWADLAEGRLAGVFLVGGASRIPLVATMLHRALDEAPVVIEQPELVVAEGSILAEAAMLTTGPAAPGPTSEMRLPSALAVPTTAVAEPSWVGPTAKVTRGAKVAQDGSTTDQTTQDDSGAEQVARNGVAGEPAGPVSPAPVRTPAAVPAWSAPTEQVAGAGGQPLDEAWPARRWDEAAALKLHEELWPDGQPSGTQGAGVLGPAVDPWPNAAAHPWVEDPDQTVAQPWEHDGEAWAAPATLAPAGPASAGPASAGPVSVSPAAGGASASAPVRGGQRATTRTQPAPTRVQPSTPARAAVKARPQSPAGSKAVRPEPVRPKPARSGPRRRGGALRAVQVLLSIVVLISAPVLSAVAAYGYGNALPPRQDAYLLARDLLELIQSW
jgi:actin-like ATPase involved in cell morphogenesis